MKKRFDAVRNPETGIWEILVPEKTGSLGGFTWPKLNNLGELTNQPVRLTIWQARRNNKDDLKRFLVIARNRKNISVFLDDNKLYVVEAAARLSDVGIKVRTRDGENKTVKRLKTSVTRPARMHLEQEEIRGIVLPANKALDGWIVISKRLRDKAAFNLVLDGDKPVQEQILRVQYTKDVPLNIRIDGNVVDVETGRTGQAKGNGCAWLGEGDLPEGIDFITSEDNFKQELIASDAVKIAYFLAEPQGMKEAYTDRQTFVNFRADLTVKEAETRMRDARLRALKDIKVGVLTQSLEQMSSAIMNTPWAWDVQTFETYKKWVLFELAMHMGMRPGVSYQVSRWLTQEAAKSWVYSLGLYDPKRDTDDEDSIAPVERMRIKIPCAVRTQPISVAAARLAGADVEVQEGDLAWLPQLKVWVATDKDWVDVIIPSHGGCDLDDAFVGRYRTIKGEKKILLTRSPNSRGEWTLWNYVEGDWFPHHITHKDKKVTFPAMGSRWPKQILKAIKDGDVIPQKMPSKSLPKLDTPWRDYQRSDVINAIMELINNPIAGGYGMWELHMEALNSLSLTVLDDRPLNSEDAIDAFTQNGHPLDRAFVMEDLERLKIKIMNICLTEGKAVDVILGRRLNMEGLPMTDQGPLSRIRRIMVEAKDRYLKDVEDFARTLQEPEWLKELGDNEFLKQATRALKDARWQHYQLDKKYKFTMSWDDRQEMLWKAVEDIILGYLRRTDDPALRAQYVMAFWHACWTVPKSNGDITDQYVFGTKMYKPDGDDVTRGYLLDALIFYGIAAEVEVTDRGTISRTQGVVYQGNQLWSIKCVNCGTEYENVGLQGLIRYWGLGRLCKNCR